MNYSLITEEKLTERARNLPPDISEILNSAVTLRTIERVGEEHSMDEERMEMLLWITGLVLFGFLQPEALADEINKELRLNHRHSQEVAKDLENKIFEPIKHELEELYQPLSGLRNEEPFEEERGEEEAPAPTKQSAGLRSAEPRTSVAPPPEPKISPRPAPELEQKTIPSEIFTSEKPITIETDGSAPTSVKATAGKEVIKDKPADIEAVTGGAEKEEDAPFVLHKEKSLFSESKGKRRPRRGFSFSLGKIFESGTPPKTPPPEARVETSGPHKKKGEVEKKTVHYSEYRTPLSGEGDEFIDLSALRPATTEKKDPSVSTNSVSEASLPAQAENSKKVKVHAPVPKSGATEKKDEAKPRPVKTGKAKDGKEKNDKGPELEGNIINLRQQ